nr:MAG TPA: hypothetical protein [Bacteriophage sp.]
MSTYSLVMSSSFEFTVRKQPQTIITTARY